MTVYPSVQKEQKKRISLSIKEEVINQARQAGIKNISALTESILQALAFSAEKNTKEDLIAAYESFFKTIQPILEKYGCSIKVGYIPALPNEPPEVEEIIMLYEDSLKTEDQFGNATTTSTSQVLSNLDPLKQILDNLLPTLIRAAQENKDKIQEFELALRFFNSMAHDVEESKN